MFLLILMVILDVCSSIIPSKTKIPQYYLTQRISKLPGSKAVADKCHWSGGHNKPNCLQDRTNFHTSRPCQVVLIFNIALAYFVGCTLYIYDNVMPYYGPLGGESIGRQWIPPQRANNAKLWCSVFMRLNKLLKNQSSFCWFVPISCECSM